MRYYKCSVCAGLFEWEAIEDPTKCLSCGHEGKVGEHFTEAPPVRIVFVDKDGQQIYIHKTDIVGRDTFRLFQDYKYVSKEQFKVHKDEEKGWSIEGLENTTNPTYLNGEKVEPAQIINIDYKKDNEILIGNKENDTGLKFKIAFE